jgi:hypothetical protein
MDFCLTRVASALILAGDKDFVTLVIIFCLRDYHRLGPTPNRIKPNLTACYPRLVLVYVVSASIAILSRLNLQHQVF